MNNQSKSFKDIRDFIIDIKRQCLQPNIVFLVLTFSVRFVFPWLKIILLFLDLIGILLPLSLICL